ncbi:uncharacterized protein [Arachis hypogaea]|uniref:uncharacterized protein isoform X2 n=1 Tax=Arachis hypogaea TaxID=3818 RepID=UPI003B219246
MHIEIDSIRNKVPQEIWLWVHNKHRHISFIPNTRRGLARHKIQETPKETEEIVQNLMQDEDLVPADSSDEYIKMLRIGHYMKISKLDTTYQQFQVGSAAASSSHQVDCLILPSNSNCASAASSLHPFRPPCSEPLPAPQTCTNGVQNSELGVENLDPEADEVDSFEQHVDNLFAASEAQKRKG